VTRLGTVALPKLSAECHRGTFRGLFVTRLDGHCLPKGPFTRMDFFKVGHVRYFLSGIAGHCQALSDIVRHCRTLSDIVRHCQTLSDIVGHCRTLSDIVGHCRTLSDIVGHCLILSGVQCLLTNKFIIFCTFLFSCFLLKARLLFLACLPMNGKK
jgi:hypothetical protein